MSSRVLMKKHLLEKCSISTERLTTPYKEIEKILSSPELQSHSPQLQKKIEYAARLYVRNGTNIPKSLIVEILDFFANNQDKLREIIDFFQIGFTMKEAISIGLLSINKAKNRISILYQDIWNLLDDETKDELEKSVLLDDFTELQLSKLDD